MHNPYTNLRVTQTWAEHVKNGGSPGVDFGADEGTPIYAPCDGTMYFFWNGDAGYDTVIYQADGSSERACHDMDNALARSLSMTRVTEGQHVSYSGNTGDSTGGHIHCNGWMKDGTRIPPFGQTTTSAGLDSAPFPAGSTAVPTSGDEFMYWRHTSGLVASLDTTRGVYRYLYGWELNGLVEEEKAGRVAIHLLGSPEWEATFGPLQLNGTVEIDGAHEAIDDSDLDALAKKIAATQPKTADIVRQVVAGVAAADDAEHTALQAAITALAAQSAKLPDEVRKKLANALLTA